MLWGLDQLGAARYADLAVREHPHGWAFGIFDTTFGNGLGVCDRIAATGRAPLIRTQLLWSDTHQFGDSDIPAIKKRARLYQQLKTRFPSVTIEISPFCEHNLKAPDKYLEIVQHEAPDCIAVNVPYKGALSTRFKNEVHGTHGRPSGHYNYSFDGTPCVDANVQTMKGSHLKADVFFFWTSQFNGRKNPNDKTPRPQRKAWPVPDLIDSVIYLHREAGKVSLPKRYLWKSHADQHEAPVPEPRALKPVFIIPPKVRRVELLARNGQVVAVSGSAQPFADGRWRYYFGQYGYQLAEKARRIQGDAIVSVVLDGKVVGQLNPAFRAGDFR